MKKIIGLLILILIGAGVAFYYVKKQDVVIKNENKKVQLGKEEELIFADASTVWWTAPTIVAKTKGFFGENGLKVKAFDVNTGLASKNAVLSGSADVGLV